MDRSIRNYNKNERNGADQDFVFLSGKTHHHDVTYLFCCVPNRYNNTDLTLAIGTVWIQTTIECTRIVLRESRTSHNPP